MEAHRPPNLDEPQDNPIYSVGFYWLSNDHPKTGQPYAFSDRYQSFDPGFSFTPSTLIELAGKIPVYSKPALFSIDPDGDCRKNTNYFNSLDFSPKLAI